MLNATDEFLCEAHEDCAEEVGAKMASCYTYASERMFEWHKEKSQWFRDLTFKIDLNGGYKIGYTYLDVH